MRIGITSDLHYGFEEYITSHIIDEFLAKLETENIDLLIIAGDIISHKQSQWDLAFTMIRKYFPNIPICIVFGNHDYWDRKLSFNEVARKQFDSLNKYNIRHLPSLPYETDDLIIYGIGGWYGSSFPPTNDIYHMQKRVGDVGLHDYMFIKERNQLSLIPDKGGNKTILVTHFEPSDDPHGGPDWWENFNDRCDILIVGHTHKPCDKQVMDMRVINPGSDYNDPKYVILEV